MEKLFKNQTTGCWMLHNDGPQSPRISPLFDDLGVHTAPLYQHYPIPTPPLHLLHPPFCFADVREVFDLFDFWDGRDGLVDGAKIGEMLRCCGLNPTNKIVLKNGGTEKFGMYRGTCTMSRPPGNYVACRNRRYSNQQSAVPMNARSKPASWEGRVALK